MDPIWSLSHIQLLEYPIPPRARPARPSTSQKPPSADISETESGIIDPLVSKQPEKNLNIKKYTTKNIKQITKNKQIKKSGPLGIIWWENSQKGLF